MAANTTDLGNGHSVASRPERVVRVGVAGLRRSALAELAVFAMLAVGSTWPLARHLDTHLPQGMESVATVPLFTAWTVWWNADRALHGYRGYWDAPIFAPTPGAFAFSEPMPTTLIVAPLVWIAGGHPLLAHNVFLLAGLTLNGWATFQLLRCLRLRWLVCLVGGGMLQILPLVHSELGVLQMVPLGGILWTIYALCLFARRPGARRAWMLAAAFACTYLTCAYYGLFLSLVLLPSVAWLLGKRLCRGRTWCYLAASGGLALLLVAPVLVAQVRIIRTHQLRRGPEWVTHLSASPRDYAVTPWPPRFQPDCPAAWRVPRYFRLAPGWWKIGLAAIGAALGLWRRRYRRWTLFCLTVLVTAFLLSLGPKLAWGGWSPYTQLMDWYPGLAQARNVYRFAIFVQLTVALLAALGLQGIAGRWRRATRGSVLRGALAVGLGLLAIAEVLPPAQNLFPVPAVETQRGWIRWLQTETPAGSVIACVPFPAGTRVGDYEQTALWMFWGTFHHRRMVNGYSGFFPQSFLETKAALAGFPDAASVQRLRQVGATYCVVAHAASVAMESAPRGTFELVFQDDRARVDVYRIRADEKGDRHRNDG